MQITRVVGDAPAPLPKVEAAPAPALPVPTAPTLVSVSVPVSSPPATAPKASSSGGAASHSGSSDCDDSESSDCDIAMKNLTAAVLARSVVQPTSKQVKIMKRSPMMTKEEIAMVKTKQEASKMIKKWIAHQKSGGRVRPHKKSKSSGAAAGVATPGNAAVTDAGAGAAA